MKHGSLSTGTPLLSPCLLVRIFISFNMVRYELITPVLTLSPSSVVAEIAHKHENIKLPLQKGVFVLRLRWAYE